MGKEEIPRQGPGWDRVLVRTEEMGEEVNCGAEREVRSQGRGGRIGEGGRRAHRDFPFVYQFSRLWLSYPLVRSVSIPLLEESSGEPHRSCAANREWHRPQRRRCLGG